MALCLKCGADNREGARFCDSCAAPLTTTAPTREQRKTVTVLFCDVTGSTQLGERLDPEALRALLARYFEEMKAIVERHGGVVEKFIGDAVMAVFGIPMLHEDDALRALRAALEMQDAFPALGIQGRIGVTTGEVVTGTEERLATGDAVNVAARLEQAAQPGEILIGFETQRLTRDAADVEALEPLVLKGKADPVPTFRLLGVQGDEGFARRTDAPLVGREREQRLLWSAWDRVVSERACQLFTILGAGGVGKSRLAAEFLTSVSDAVVVRGRCLSYGEGITYWPVIEVLRQLPGSDPGPVVQQTIASLLEDGRQITSSEEIAWAFRKQCEVVAAAKPLVCVFDDLHWGEETFLDLVEYVADLSRDVPILLLCMARPDLLDRRKGWGGGNVNATTVLLEPLAPRETELLIDHLTHVDARLRAQIRDTAEGNPLFVEEMVALLQESGADEVGIPPTIQALLAARLDQLEPSERSVLECGSVEGRSFHRGAVQALTPDDTPVAASLTSLVRKELIRPDTSELAGDDAFRFRHLLGREAAYEALPKARRASLHEQFAGWLDEHGGGQVGLDELVGYHLEQADRFQHELGRPSGSLASRAAAKLGSAGRRALDRGDMEGACNLLERAIARLEDGDRTRLELEVDLGEALLEGGRLTEAEALLEATVVHATSCDDELLRARAQVGLALVRLQTQGAGAHAKIQRDVEPLLTVLEEANDHRGAADALTLLGTLARWSTDYETASGLIERALEHARSAGDERRQATIIRHIASTALWGPEHVDAALARCQAIISESSNGRVRASCLVRIGGLEGLAGRFDAARDAIAAAREIMDDLGLRYLKAHSTDVAVMVAMLAGDFDTAEQEARDAYVTLGEMGDLTYQASQAALIAEALEARGRLDEAEEWLGICEQLEGGVLEDPEYLAVAALIAGRRGRLDEAEALLRASLADGGDVPVPVACDVRLTLAEILTQMGRNDEAREEAEECLRRFESKGIVPLTTKAKALIAQTLEPASGR